MYIHRSRVCAILYVCIYMFVATHTVRAGLLPGTRTVDHLGVFLTDQCCVSGSSGGLSVRCWRSVPLGGWMARGQSWHRQWLLSSEGSNTHWL